MNEEVKNNSIEEARGLARHAFANEVNLVHRAYIDMAGDLIAGHLFSQIMYWFEPDKKGESKIRVRKKDGFWLAKSRKDWYEEIRISPKQYDRAVKILTNKDLVETKLYRFNGSPMVHIRPKMETYNKLLDEWIENKAQEIQKSNSEKLENLTILTKGKNPNLPKGNMKNDKRVKSLTETTTETPNQKLLNINNKESNSDCSVLKTDIETKAGQWEWKSDKQYIDYIEKVLPKMIRNISSEFGKDSNSAYEVFLMITGYYFNQYKIYNGQYHVWYREDTLRECFDALFEFFKGHLVVGDVKDYIDQFFSHKKLREKPFKVFCSYNMLEILKNEFEDDWNN